MPAKPNRSQYTEAFRHHADDRMVQLTFWEGLQILATTQIERLERCAAADGCQRVIESVQVAKSIHLYNHPIIILLNND